MPNKPPTLCAAMSQPRLAGQGPRLRKCFGGARRSLRRRLERADALRHRSAGTHESDSAVAGAGRSGRADLERRDSAAPKTGPERFRAAAALIRLGGSLRIVAEPMLYRRPDRPSRRRHREHSRAGSVFPRREVGGPTRPARTGVRRLPVPTLDCGNRIHVRELDWIVVDRLYSSSGAACPSVPDAFFIRYTLMNPSRSPSSTRVGSPTSSFVRWSLTI